MIATGYELVIAGCAGLLALGVFLETLERRADRREEERRNRDDDRRLRAELDRHP